MTHVCIQSKMTDNTLKRHIENSKSPLVAFVARIPFSTDTAMSQYIPKTTYMCPVGYI